MSSVFYIVSSTNNVLEYFISSVNVIYLRMKKSEKNKICDWILVFLLPIVFASSIQLEITSSKGFLPIILHIVVAISFMCLIIWHIYLHFNWQKWLTKFSKLKVQTRILWWLYVLTFISGLAVFIHWIVNQQHSPLGGIHGKIGFLMIAFAIGHLIVRWKRLYK